MRKNNVVWLVVLWVCANVAFAQEKLVGLDYNPALKQLAGHERNTNKSATVLQLPFFDDFSNYQGYPKDILWADNHAFVNSSYGVFPPTVGVATLDALDAWGNLHAMATTSVFSADTLTSNIIRLDSLFTPYKKAVTVADSIYLSFYFQPGGGYGNMWERIGNAPSADDSLMLDLYDAGNDKWNTVWASGGFDLDTLYAHTGFFFKYVAVAITDSIYFSDSFRFRFRNYCSLDNSAKPGIAANTDQWNIDYVYLSNSRTCMDTTTRDIAFVLSAPSFLKDYQAMPSKQFRQSDMKTNASLTITNMYSTALECNYSYIVEQNNGSVVSNYSGGHDNISPFYPSGEYQTAEAHANPPIDFAFTVNTNSPSVFTIKHIIKNGITGDLHPENDTIIFNQVFDNYYAYDDGTPENGYGLTSSNNVMFLAYKFKLNTADTLTAIDMFFNQTMDGENTDIPFYITIWDDNNGLPGNVIYKSSDYSYPKFGEMNQYRRYVLERPVRVNGMIYIGFEQHSRYFINLGFDRNNDARQYIYYRTGMEWQQSILSGALMMRPYFGAKATIGITNNPNMLESKTIKVYPNPAKDRIFVSLPDDTLGDNYTIYIYSMQGKCVYAQPLLGGISTASFANGLYMIKVVDNNTKQQYTTKIVVAK